MLPHTTTTKHKLLQSASDPQNGRLHAPLLELHFAPAVRLQASAWLRSEEVGLLHDPQELLLVPLAISVSVGLVDHLLKLLVGHPLPELLGDPLQVLEGDLAGLVVVEEPEGLEDLVLRVAVQDLVCHHLQELFVAYRSTAVVVDIGDHLLDLLLLRLEPQGTHGNLELLGVDLSGAVGVKEVEGLLDLLLLLLRQLLLLLASGVESTERHDSQRLLGGGPERSCILNL